MKITLKGRSADSAYVQPVATAERIEVEIPDADLHFALKGLVAPGAVPRAFWRYLFAGLYLPTTPPAIAVRDADALLAELEKKGGGDA